MASSGSGGLGGRALAEAYVKVRADMTSVGPDVQKGLAGAVDRAAGGASRRMRGAIAKPVKEGLAEGARAAGPGGEAVGSRIRQGIAGRMRGVAADTAKAGGQAGEGFARGAEAGVGKSSGRLKSSVGRVATGMAAAFAGVAVGERVIDFFKGAIEGASDLSEAGNKLQVLFGPAAPKIEEWAKGAATALGQSRLQAENAAATFGIFAKSAGLSGQGAADFSTKMVGLAGDMASFNNTTPEQAIEAVGAALRGESEPIRAYGVLLDDATLRQQALKLGLISTTKEALTPQQRVLAAQAAIMAQTTAAQGDFARTSGGLANQQRILSAQFANAQAALGEKLLPVMLRVVTFLNTTAVPAFTGLVDLLGRIPGPVYAVIGVIGGVVLFGKAIGAIKAQALAASQGLQAMGLSAAGANTALAGIAKGGGVVALAAVAAQLEEASGGFTSAKVGSDELVRSLTELGTTGRAGGASLDVFKQGWGPFAQDVHTSSEAITTFGEMAKGAIGSTSESFLDMVGRWQSGSDRMGRLTSVTEQYDAALAKMATGGSAAAAKTVFDQLTGSAKAQGVNVDELRKLFPQYTAALGASTAASGAAAGATKGLAGAQNAAQVAATAQKRAVDALTASLTSSQNATLIARGGEAGYEAAVDAVTAAVKANGRTLDVHTEKGRTNRAALDSLASAGLDYLGVIQKNNGVGPVFRRTLDQQWQKLYEAARRFGATRADAKRYADQILATPKSLATKVTTPGLAAARAAVQGLHTDVNNLSNRTIKITVNSDGTFTQGTRKGRATGGPIPGISPSPTADNIPIAATAGEHMWSVAEVQGAGGHGQVERLRRAARTGGLPRFAAGGSITVRGAARMPSTSTLNAVIDADMMAAYKRAFEAGGAGGPGGPVPTGAGVARWGPMVHLALAKLGLAQSLWDNWMRQIASESGGNPNITQSSGVKDVNYYSGNLAEGLLQTIPSTFRAYHVPGTSWNIHDGWANMLAAMNYGNHRYDGRMEAVIGHGHGYASGTRRAAPGWAWVGETGAELVRFRGGETVKSPGASRGMDAAGLGPVRLHPDTVADLGAAFAAAAARQAVVLDGRTIAGYVDRAFGRASMSVRG